MASCFKNPNKKNLSAKDYTIKKRRNTVFCNLRQNFVNDVQNGVFRNQGNNVACLNNQGIMSKYNNHQTGLDMLAAFEDFRKDLIQNIQGQLFKEHFCAPYYLNTDNSDISNNYFGKNIQLAFGDGTSTLSGGATGTYGHLTNYFGGLNNDIISTHTESKYRNTYAEIRTLEDNDTDNNNNESGRFKNNKFMLQKPPICDNETRPQVLIASDLTPPQALSVEILIE